MKSSEFGELVLALCVAMIVAAFALWFSAAALRGCRGAGGPPAMDGSAAGEPPAPRQVNAALAAAENKEKRA